MKAAKPEVVKSLHCQGVLSGVAPGIMEGSVEFPVRGVKAFRMERRPDDHIGPCAKLICLEPYSEADMVLIQQIDEADHWHGFISIEGYIFQVRVQRDGRKMALTFFDSKQPVWCVEALA